jgi:rSAM/selenodomain-associated transferase 2
VTATPAAAPPLSVIVPVRNEAGRLPLLLADLGRAPRLVREVLVVDGGSEDRTPLLARLGGALTLMAGGGRGPQLACGAERAAAPWLLLLHADVRLPAAWPAAVAAALAQGEEAAWAFGLRIDAGGAALRLVELAVRLRSRWAGLPYGDQGLLLPRRLLEAVGGVPPLPLMEDLELVRRLRVRARIRGLDGAVRVDARRWRRLGVWRTAIANSRLRRAWRRGVPAAELAARYYGRG